MEKKQPTQAPQGQDRENPSSPTSTNAPNHPYPTTFVQADTSSFKQVVQMLTGSAETAAAAAAANNSPQPKNPIPAKATGPKKPAFKLYERRNSLKNLNIISPLVPTFHHPTTAFSPPRKQQQAEILSPSMLDFPSLLLSPVTPLIPDPFNRSAEEKAIAEKGFYLHPSPRSGGGNKDFQRPRLLPLFPVTSPRASSSECGLAQNGYAS